MIGRPRTRRSLRCGVLESSRGAVVAMLCALVGVSQVAGGYDTARSPERLRRVFTEEHGLPSATVSSLAQDAEGFLWVGTHGGLARFDGHEIVVVHSDIFGGGVHQLAASGGGLLAVVERGRRQLYWLESGSVRAAVRANGEVLREVRWASFDGDRILWVVLEDGELLRLDSDGAEHPTPELSGRARRVLAQAGGEMLITTTGPEGGTLWSWVRSSEGARRIVTLPGVRLRGALRRSNGSLVFSTLGDRSRLLRFAEGEIAELELRNAPVDHLVERRGDLYLSDAFGLDILTSVGEHERLGAESGLFSGGPLLVDREGSLWMGTAEGLVQFPEPATRSWNGLHGLPSGHTTDVEPTAVRVLVSTWQGLGTLEREAGGWSARDLEREGIELWPGSRLCADRGGRAWMITRGRSAALSALVGEQLQASRAVTQPIDCDRLEDGELLIVADDQVLSVRGDSTEPETLGPSPGEPGAQWVAGAADGRLAVQSGGLVCVTDRERLGERGVEAWECGAVGDVGEVRDLLWVEGPRGEELWLASFTGGARRLPPEGSWREVDALAGLPSRAATALARSPRGGVWVSGFGFVCRLEPSGLGDRSRGDEAWRIVERLGVWHGASGGARAIEETEDGAVWLATWRGVTEIPAAARETPARAPPIVLVAQSANGRPLDVERMGGGALEISSRERLELRFAGLSLRDPERISYRLRLGADDDWIVSRDATFRFVQPAPGRYQLEAASSLDGSTWSRRPIRLELRVVGPWYRRPLALVGWAALGVLSLWTAHRLRTAHLISLERQRTRIAMDLHDELGAGLGSVGILGGVLASGTRGPEEVERLGARIARTARELGESLHDILASLRSGNVELESLFQQVALRGRSLLGAGETRLVVVAPQSLPRHRFELEDGHHLQTLLIEALHNAARHAGASKIELGVEPETPSGGLRLWVTDDGRGFDPETVSTGMGLEGMRRRAAALGAELRLEAGPEGGTRVELMVRPRPSDRWWSVVRRPPAEATRPGAMRSGKIRSEPPPEEGRS